MTKSNPFSHNKTAQIKFESQLRKLAKIISNIVELHTENGIVKDQNALNNLFC